MLKKLKPSTDDLQLLHAIPLSKDVSPGELIQKLGWPSGKVYYRLRRLRSMKLVAPAAWKGRWVRSGPKAQARKRKDEIQKRINKRRIEQARDKLVKLDLALTEDQAENELIFDSQKVSLNLEQAERLLAIVRRIR